MALQDALNNLAQLRAPAVDNTRVAVQQPKQEVYDPSTFVKRSDQLTGFIGYSAGGGGMAATGLSYTGIFAQNGAWQRMDARRQARNAEAMAIVDERMARQQAQQQGNGMNFFQTS